MPLLVSYYTQRRSTRRGTTEGCVVACRWQGAGRSSITVGHPPRKREMSDTTVKEVFASKFARDEWAFCTCNGQCMLHKKPEPDQHKNCMVCGNSFATVQAEYEAKVLEWTAHLEKEKIKHAAAAASVDDFEENHHNCAKAVYNTFAKHVFPAWQNNKKYWDDNNDIFGETVEEAMLSVNVEYNKLTKASDKSTFLDKFRKGVEGEALLEKLKETMESF
jgi:hypothetical protein